LVLLLPTPPNPPPDNHWITLGGIAYCERKFLNEDPFLHKTTEQLTENWFPLCTHVKETAGFPLKMGVAEAELQVPVALVYTQPY
jgi:hypothetical protein